MEYRVILADSHVNEPSNCYQDRLPARLKEIGPRIAECDDGGEGWTVEGRVPRSFGLGAMAGKDFKEYQDTGMRFSDLLSGNYEPKEHLKDQDRDGVDASVIYPGFGMGLPTIQDRDLRLACYRAYKDWFAEQFGAGDPRRIIGLAPIPVDDGVEEAVTELQRAVGKGHRGGFLATYPDKPYFDRSYDPLWAAAQELEVPLHFHRSTGRNVPPGMRVSQAGGPSVARIALGFFPAMEPICYMIFSGVFDRFPGLKIVSAESDFGWLPFYMQICDDQFTRQRHWSKLEFDNPPSDYIRRQVFFTFMDDEVGCANLRYTGSDNLMWASDYPHSVTTWHRSQEYIDKQMAHCTAEERGKLLAGNAIRLYKLDS